MLNRLTAVLVVVAAAAGYALAGSPAAAQDKPRRLPYAITRGQRITLVFAHATRGEGGSALACVVADESDSWVRCTPPEDGGFSSSRDQHWYDLTRVVEIVRPERQP